MYSQLEQTYANDKRSSYKLIQLRFREACTQYQDAIKQYDNQYNENLKAINAQKEAAMLDIQTHNINMQNLDTANAQNDLLKRMNKIGMEIADTGNQTLSNLTEQKHRLLLIKDDQNDIKANINQGKQIATRITNREFCYKLSLFILAAILTAVDVAIIIYLFQKQVMKP